LKRCENPDKLKKKQFGMTGRRLPSTRGICCHPVVDLIVTIDDGDIKIILDFIEQP
jgi:hypothetical protein